MAMRDFLNSNVWKETKKKARRSLARYIAVARNEKPAKFLIAKKVPADFSRSDSVELLWRKHAKLTDEFCRVENEIDNACVDLQKMPIPAKSYLDLKVEIARRILESCHFCSRRCGVNRLAGQRGYCGCGERIAISSAFPHMGEEPELVPSGTVFTLGCTIRCLHCQNWEISQWIEHGENYPPQHLAKVIEDLRKCGCLNANLVGGEPTPWLEAWLEVFANVKANVPVVWNSNSYYSEETAKLLAGFVDVYLLDFKYGDHECSTRISDAPRYWEACTRNHLYGKKYGELLVRVLVLPEHLECCTRGSLDWIAKHLGVNVRTNLMFQYRPEWRAREISELRRQVSRQERKKAVQIAEKSGLKNLVK
jgi:putative pyruvate formate lyase activating enzyme